MKNDSIAQNFEFVYYNLAMPFFYMNLHDYHDKWLFIPFGGSGEIGMNFNAYHYRGQWIIVDCGTGFASDQYPGIDVMIPNIEFLIENKANILCILVTHMHEDHIGAIQYMWPTLKVPVYATPFSADFLKSKLKANTSFATEVPINQVEVGSAIQIGDFKIEMVPLAHSTIEMQALSITTDLGTIFHTGDWHFDDTALVGKETDTNKLKDIGEQKNVIAVVGDSTNIFYKEQENNEYDLRKNLINMISKCNNTVAIATFASNIARIETLILAAKNSGRKILISGTSLERVVSIAKDNGYLTDFDEDIFISKNQIKSIPRNQRLIICTGCQGEESSVLQRLAAGNHRYCSLQKDDTVILSSKIIPGNEKRISALVNDLGFCRIYFMYFITYNIYRFVLKFQAQLFIKEQKF